MSRTRRSIVSAEISGSMGGWRGSVARVTYGRIRSVQAQKGACEVRAIGARVVTPDTIEGIRCGVLLAIGRSDARDDRVAPAASPSGGIAALIDHTLLRPD